MSSGDGDKTGELLGALERVGQLIDAQRGDIHEFVAIATRTELAVSSMAEAMQGMRGELGEVKTTLAEVKAAGLRTADGVAGLRTEVAELRGDLAAEVKAAGARAAEEVAASVAADRQRALMAQERALALLLQALDRDTTCAAPRDEAAHAVFSALWPPFQVLTKLVDALAETRSRLAALEQKVGG